MRWPFAKRIYSAGDPPPKKNSRFDELMPPLEATLRQLEYAKGQKAIWDTEVARIEEHLLYVQRYEKEHPTTGIAPGHTAV